MHPQALIPKKVFYFFLLLFATYSISLFIYFYFEPAPIANILGFISLLFYIVTLIPSIFKTIFPTTKKHKILRYLFKNRRYIGVTAFSFGLSHGVLLILERNLSLSNPYTYIQYCHGMSTLLIFTILAVTSNDWSVRALKSNWKKLHRLTYLMILLLGWHILASMSSNWSHLTLFEVLLTITTAILFIRKKWVERIE